MRGILKKFTTNRTRRRLAFAVVSARQPTARWRPLPNLLVIGAQRCGTSSLFKYLGSHPQCHASIRKEIRYFTEYYDRGQNWYRSHFPLSLDSRNGSQDVYFEATPDYLLDPRVPEKVKQLLPNVRLVALLRNPIERAYSHYCHNRRLGTEWVSFAEALEQEGGRIGSALDQVEKLKDGPIPKSLLRYSYVERGRYATQLQRWLDVFDKDRLLILQSERFYAETDQVFQEILRFLGLSVWRPESYSNFSYAEKRPAMAPMPVDCRLILEAELGPEIEQLGHLVDDSLTQLWLEAKRS